MATSRKFACTGDDPCTSALSVEDLCSMCFKEHEEAPNGWDLPDHENQWLQNQA